MLKNVGKLPSVISGASCSLTPAALVNIFWIWPRAAARVVYAAVMAAWKRIDCAWVLA
jgi:hypothetical protein